MDPSQDLLPAVGDDYSVEILCATEHPMSARKLSEATGIPIATCYRRIERLVEAGLLEEEGKRLSDEGRRTTVYRRAVDEVSIDLTGPRPRLSVEERAADRVGDGRRAAWRDAEAEP